MARVFLSHASDDRERTGQLHQWLVGEGHEVFLDRDLRDGIRGGAHRSVVPRPGHRTVLNIAAVTDDDRLDASSAWINRAQQPVHLVVRYGQPAAGQRVLVLDRGRGVLSELAG